MTIVADPNVDPQGLLACQSLANSRSFALVRYFAEIDSTNSAALRDLESICSARRLYLADVQTSGRGRHGRTWVADSGTLTFSLVIPAVKTHSHHAAPISIAAGVAIARAIEHLATPFTARLKWPNDVYLDEGKVAGILIEAAPTRHHAIVIGVGLNVATNFRDHDLIDDSSTKSICELTQCYPQRYQWLAECVGQLIDAVEEQIDQPHKIIDEHRRRCLLNGNPIRYLQAGQWLHGDCEGIDESGALLVRTHQTQHHLTSGEVHRVRRTE